MFEGSRIQEGDTPAQVCVRFTVCNVVVFSIGSDLACSSIVLLDSSTISCLGEMGQVTNRITCCVGSAVGTEYAASKDHNLRKMY